MGLYTELVALLFCYPHKYLKKNHFYLAIPHTQPHTVFIYIPSCWALYTDTALTAML